MQALILWLAVGLVNNKKQFPQLEIMPSSLPRCMLFNTKK